MSKFHVHIAVNDLARNIEFYTALFGVGPSTTKPDYAKWDLDNPPVNFAISDHGVRPGIEHVGLQADSEQELEALQQRMQSAGYPGLEQENTTCCYARSDKYWSVDPQGVPWEAFRSLGEAPVFSDTVAQGNDKSCCAPSLSGCCS